MENDLITLTLPFSDWNRIVTALITDEKALSKDAEKAYQQDVLDYAEVLWGETHEINRLKETIRFELETKQ